MSKRAWGTGVLALAAMSAAAAILPVNENVAQAAVVTIVDDTWLDGTDSDPAAPAYSENGVDADLDGNIESAWFQGGAGSLDPVGVGGPLRGNMTAGGTSSASWTTYITPEATPITLAQGEKLTVNWQFSLTNVNAANTSQNFRVGLVDSPSATRIAGPGTPGAGAYTGYAMFMNMAQTLGNSNPFQLRERITNPGTGFLSTSGDWGALANGATSGNTGYVAGTNYAMTWELERTLLDELLITVSMAGGSLDNDGLAQVSFTDPTPNGFTFDTFSIRPSGATTTAELFDTSRFTVQYNQIPEPASLSLLGLAVAALGRRRRRAE